MIPSHDELLQMADIERNAFPEGDQEESFEFTTYWLGSGYYALAYDIAEDRLRLANLAVRRDRRGHGFGEDMVNDAIAQAKAAGFDALWLEVRPDNAPAMHLYRELGFTLAAVEEDYYADGAPAYRMKKLLTA